MPGYPSRRLPSQESRSSHNSTPPINAAAPGTLLVQRMIAMYDYDPTESSPNLDSEVASSLKFILFMVSLFKCLFGIEDHVALDRNAGVGYNTLVLQLIQGDILSECPRGQFGTLPSLLDSRAAMLNCYPNTCMLSREAFYNFYDGLWYDPARAQTRDLLHERQTR